MTEGKSAALQRLAVPSRQSPDLATGTGTDQFCVAAPLHGPPCAHVGQSAREARRADRPGRADGDAGGAALAERAGSQLHARRVPRARPVRRREKRRSSTTSPLLERRRSGAACARTARRRSTSRSSAPPRTRSRAVLDRVRHGTLPASVQRDAIVQQAATLAASLAARSDRWPEFRSRACIERRGRAIPRALVLAALALGWSREVALRARRPHRWRRTRRRWRWRSRSTWPSAIPSMAAIRCG